MPWGVRRIRREAREIWGVPRDLLLGRYPEFVTGGALPRGHVPVFCFHSLVPDDFERKLRYIVDNGYVTLSAHEYFQLLMGARPAPDKAVVLTFDDGRASVRSVGWPLMHRFGVKGIVFVIPGRTKSQTGPLSPTWDEVRSDPAAAKALLAREHDGEPLLTWEEIEQLARTGLFDFESHTQMHGRVHISEELAGFVTPGLQKGMEPLDVPLIRDGQTDCFAADIPLGTPLFRSLPRLAETPRFFESPEARRACVETVAAAGGAAFFASRGWFKVLRRVLERSPVTGRLETPDQREASQRQELALSKRAIEDHTGKEVTHLCYPWHISGATARRLAHETGYRTAFCGKVNGVPITLAGGDPLTIARVGEDYVELLPGKGRVDLPTILHRKWRRRLRGLRPVRRTS